MRRKIERELNEKDTKPTVVNQQRTVYSFQCDLCHAGYVGYTQSIHNRAKGHKQQSSAIAQTQKERARDDPSGSFSKYLKNAETILTVWCTKCLIRALKPNFNVQSDSIHARVFL